MAYNPSIYMPYGQQSFPQPVAQPNWMYQPTQTQPQPMQQPFDNIIGVSGRKGADAFAMGPNSRAILFDDTEDVMYRVTTDGAGVKTIAEFDFTPREAVHERAAEYATRDELAAFGAKLDEVMAKLDSLPRPRTRKAAGDGE